MPRKIICPSCASAVHPGDEPQLQQRVTCLVCGSEAEIVELDPLELKWESGQRQRNDDKEFVRGYQSRIADF